MTIELKITATDAQDLIQQLAAFFPRPATTPMVVVPQAPTQPLDTPIRGATAEEAGRRKSLKIKPVEEPKADEPEAETPAEEPKAEEPKAEEPKAATPAEEPKAEEPKDTGADPLDYETVIKPAVLSLALKKGRPVVMEVLDALKAGCTSAKDLDKKDWPKLLDAISAKLEA